MPNNWTLLKINLIFLIGILYEIYVGLNVVLRLIGPSGALPGTASHALLIPDTRGGWISAPAVQAER